MACAGRAGALLGEGHVIGAPPAERVDAGPAKNKLHPTLMESAKCRVGTFDFSIALASPTGVPSEENMELRFARDADVAVANDRPGWFELLPAGVIPSVCDKALAIELPSQLVLLPLWRSGKPQLDTLAGAIYDPSIGEVRAFQIMADIYTEPFQLKAIPQGLSVFSVRFRPGDGPEGMTEGWKNITFDGRTIVSRWDQTQPTVKH